ncbi:MAG: hypothetical protein KBS61_03040 [Chryseobacterium sp.]|nr:hypothetical protein [Candidatus Chryseobacterium enterohippi]
MFLRFLKLEFKSFFRSSSLVANIGMKILMVLATIYFIGIMLALSIGGYEIVKSEMHQNPMQVLASGMIYFWIADLVLRHIWQQLSTQNVKPFLSMNISKKQVVRYTLAKTLTSFFSWVWAFFFIPFSIRLLIDGFSVVGVLGFNIAAMAIVYFNNFLNILLNGKDLWVYGTAIVFAALGGLDYYEIFSLREVSQKVFFAFYEHPWLAIVPVVFLVAIVYIAYQFVYKTFYLDEGLEVKKEVGKTQNIAFLEKYGAVGTFINNDIRLLRRSKAAKGVLVSSVLFLCYGLLIFSGGVYQKPFMMIFMGLFVTGGFQFMFGQKIPSFDSSYYPLMMTSNVPYKDYLNAKWWLMNIVTAISLIIATFYIYYGWQLYLGIVAGSIYNIGVNSQLVLLGGAYNKSPVDLNSKAKAFSQKNSFNLKTFLLMIPQMGIPMSVFGVVDYFFNIYYGILCIAILGIIGFLLKEKTFNYIVSLYKKEKYSTLIAFKQTN